MILKKSFLAVICGLFLSANANAALVDAVSVVVDNEPITIYEIYRLSKQFDISTKEALEILIQEKLELSQIKQMNIQVDDFMLNQQIEAIAAKNNMSVQNFYSALFKEGISADTYRSELKQRMQRDRLYQYILSSKYENIDEDRLLVYYNNNQIEFTRFESFDVVKIEGAQADDVAAVFNNDNQTDNTSAKSSYVRISSVDEDPKLISSLIRLEVGERTPIVQTSDGFASYVVVAKNGKSVIPFEQVKNAILTKLSSVQESTIIKEYFETVKARASITIIRLP